MIRRFLEGADERLSWLAETKQWVYGKYLRVYVTPCLVNLTKKSAVCFQGGLLYGDFGSRRVLTTESGNFLMTTQLHVYGITSWTQYHTVLPYFTTVYYETFRGVRSFVTAITRNPVTFHQNARRYSEELLSPPSVSSLGKVNGKVVSVPCS
jgi:hypothetical protein